MAADWGSLIKAGLAAWVAYQNTKNKQDDHDAAVKAASTPQTTVRTPYGQNFIQALAPWIMQQQIQNYSNSLGKMGGNAGNINPIIQMLQQMSQNPNAWGQGGSGGMGFAPQGTQISDEQRANIMRNLTGGLPQVSGDFRGNRPNDGMPGGDYGRTDGLSQGTLSQINSLQGAYNQTLGDDPSMMDRMGLQWIGLPGSDSLAGKIGYGALGAALGVPTKIPWFAPQTDEQKAIWGAIPQFNSRYADARVMMGGSGNDAVDRMGYSSYGFLY